VFYEVFLRRMDHVMYVQLEERQISLYSFMARTYQSLHSGNIGKIVRQSRRLVESRLYP
jgi:hypothetical protein